MPGDRRDPRATATSTKLKDAAGQLTRMPGIGESTQWLGFWASLPMFLCWAPLPGLFAVPLQVFMQSRPPADKKGRMIAVMNQANWIGILFGRRHLLGAHQAHRMAATGRGRWCSSLSRLMLPIALFYHPQEREPAQRQLPNRRPRFLKHCEVSSVLPRRFAQQLRLL